MNARQPQGPAMPCFLASSVLGSEQQGIYPQNVCRVFHTLAGNRKRRKCQRLPSINLFAYSLIHVFECMWCMQRSNTGRRHAPAHAFRVMTLHAVNIKGQQLRTEMVFEATYLLGAASAIQVGKTAECTSRNSSVRTSNAFASPRMCDKILHTRACRQKCEIARMYLTGKKVDEIQKVTQEHHLVRGHQQPQQILDSENRHHYTRKRKRKEEKGHVSFVSEQGRNVPAETWRYGWPA